ncbi:MAG: DciA family protein [Kofleriaceae bacterium]
MKKKRSPRTLEMVSAGAAVADVIAQHGLGNELRAERLTAEWTDLVGARIAQRTRPDRVIDRVLVIEVASSAWLHELTLLKAQLLSGLLGRLGEPRLFDDVRFKLAGANRRPATSVPSDRRRAPVQPLTPTAATGGTREQIVAEVSKVDDEELRELIARVRITNDR